MQAVYFLALVGTTAAHASAANESVNRFIQGQCSATSISRVQREADAAAGQLVWPHRLADVTDRQQSPPVQYGYRLVKRYPHDPNAFTQGLVFLGARLFESTGLRGASTLREVDLNSGRVVKMVELDDELFGEGLAVWNRRVVQLTWQSGIAFVYDAENLQRIAEFSYVGEGWGSASVEDKLVISHGSAVLTWIDPQKDGIADALHVREGRQMVHGLNELEYVESKILANVWPSDCIAEIDHETGQVTGWLDLNGLYPQKRRPHPAAVLNGIAYNSAQKRLFVTGKYWPYLYEIERPAVQSEQRAAARE